MKIVYLLESAGLWGGVGGLLPLTDLLSEFRDSIAPTMHVDQRFLGSKVWPLVRRSILVHDSLHRIPHSRPFPKGSELPDGQHVGSRRKHKTVPIRIPVPRH